MHHWYQFWWVIFPIMGMGIGYLRIWQEHERQKRLLDLLKIYAEKGQEPPASVAQTLTEAGDSAWRRDRNPWSRVAFFSFLTAGFLAVALIGAFAPSNLQGPWVWLLIPVAAFAGLIASGVVRALTSGRNVD